MARSHIIVFVDEAIRSDLWTRLTDDVTPSTVAGLSVAEVMDPGGGFAANPDFADQPDVEDMASPGAVVGFWMNWFMSDDQLDTWEALIDPTWTENDPSGAELSYYVNQSNVGTEPTNGKQRLRRLRDDHPSLFQNLAATVTFTPIEALDDLTRKAIRARPM